MSDSVVTADPKSGGDRPESIDLWRVRMPLLNAHRTSYGTARHRDSVLVEWRDDNGRSGWGECPTFAEPGYVTETTDEAWYLLVNEFIPSLLGEWGDIAQTGTDEAVPAALAALRDARLDARLRSGAESLGGHLGASPDPVERCVVIGAHSDGPASSLRRARDALDEGAVLVKVKIGPGHDMAHLGPLCEAIGASRVAADANGAYVDPTELAAVDQLGLRYLEQPFAAGTDWETLGRFAESLATPVALDESIRCAADLLAAAHSSAGSVISVKPARVGGVHAAALICAEAEQCGLEVFIGGMLELAVGRATALALCGLPSVTVPTDLGPSSSYFEWDVGTSIETDDSGRLVTPKGPGTGIEVDRNRLGESAVDHVSFLIHRR